MSDAPPQDETFESLRPLLFSIAYRMVGSVSEAEDLVQDTYIRYLRAVEEGTEIGSLKSYLSAAVTRLAIDHLRSARVRREEYVGPWLPEPLVTDAEGDAERHVEMSDSISLAFLVLLETLSPVERAVFLLREVFDYGYGEISEIVGKSEENCRQLAARARRHVQERRPRFEASRQRRDELAMRFLAACEEGDTEALVEMLAQDVVMVGDGGGKAPAVGRPVYGREQVARFIVGLMRMGRRLGLRHRVVHVNGQPGVLSSDRDGRVISVLSLDVAEGVVQAVRSVVNPDKLRHLGAVGDFRALLREGTSGENAQRRTPPVRGRHRGPRLPSRRMDFDTNVRLEIYRFFVDRGRPPVASEVASALDVDRGSVEESLRRLADAHVLVLAPGTPYVWMANPLSAIPTPFEVEARGRTYFDNCIWDALGVVAMLGGTGAVRTSCPDCGERLEVALADGRLSSGEGVVHYAVAARHWWDDIGFN